MEGDRTKWKKQNTKTYVSRRHGRQGGVSQRGRGGVKWRRANAGLKGDGKEPALGDRYMTWCAGDVSLSCVLETCTLL